MLAKRFFHLSTWATTVGLLAAVWGERVDGPEQNIRVEATLVYASTSVNEDVTLRESVLFEIGIGNQ